MKIDVGQLEFLHKNLRSVMLHAEARTGIEFTITSIYRIGDTGVHGTLPVRGSDLRMRNRQIGEQIESFINSVWVYDPARPKIKCAILHGKDSNLHLHLQVHDSTRQKT